MRTISGSQQPGVSKRVGGILAGGLLAAVVGAVLLAQAGPAAAQGAGAALQNPQVEIAYVPPTNRNYLPIYNGLKSRAVLEEVKQFLAPLRLPRKLTVQTDQCGALARPYKPQGPVTICYEMVEQMQKVAAGMDANKRASVLAGAFIQATLHEVALGIFDVLGIPVWGRADDAADRLAAFVLLQFGEDMALNTITSTAIFFDASQKTWTGSDFARADSPEQQRFYNYLCVAYGGAPRSFAFLTAGDQPVLPLRRAGRCKDEYEQVRKAYNLRIMPYVDPDLVIKVRSMDWLLPTGAK
jgi:hypothetical protein